MRNIPIVLADQRLGGQFFAGTYAERIGNVETPQVLLSHLGTTDFNGLAPATLPEHGGNIGGMVELRFSADGGLDATHIVRYVLGIATEDDMAQSPQWKVYRNKEYIGCCKYAEDAAALVALGGGIVKHGHSMIVWTEGAEDFSAGESYDGAARIMEARVRDARHHRLTASGASAPTTPTED